MKNVALIAPITPFRSGVAKHSTQVALELNKLANINVHTFSFYRLYPSLLFPGDNDKEENTNAPESLNADFCLDAVNPYTWYKLAKKLSTMKIDAVIIPCWTFFLAPCFGWLSRYFKQKNIRVISVVHNAFDHENGQIKNALMRFQIKNSSHFICHNKALKDQISQEVTTAKIAVSPHPIFDQYPSPTEVLPRRKPVELLYFGLIRDYKGLDILLEAFSQLNQNDYFLTVVGESWGDWNKYQSQIEQLSITFNVECVIKYVSDEEAANYFTRADAVVLPYRSMTGTGVIPLAYHYNTPVICSNLPAFHEVVDDKLTGIISRENSVESLKEALEEFAQLRDQVSFKQNTQNKVNLFTWQKYCAEITNLIGVTLHENS